ncbi:hypothetical protein [Haloarcula rubripromontorii]|uniref:hypothetical protein n=1 Tax=Haloarcula rubripromontorii TaxID=1705562 RepID=UPI00345B77A9
MAGLSATAGSGFDYIQSAEPADPENAELWFDTDGGTDGNGEVKVYDGSQWDTTGYVSHDQLTNVSPGDHFSPGSGLSFSGGTLDLLLSSYLTIDGNGDLALASGSVGQDRLAFDTATQSELDGHAGDANAHHEPYSDGKAQNAVFDVLATGTVGGTGEWGAQLYDNTEDYSLIVSGRAYNQGGSNDAHVAIEYTTGGSDNGSALYASEKNNGTCDFDFKIIRLNT